MNVSISKKFEFSASHRYWKDGWSQEKNEKHFGLCVSPYGHGHNYELFVTVSGPLDRQTGMIINLSHLKNITNEILEDFDHKYLNIDTIHFKDIIPTTENIAYKLFELIDAKLSQNHPALKLEKIRLYEKDDLFAEAHR
jgi:6-pyruvoyltetrahydropterin/6-carboxytetrahydropterin synthase